MARKQLELDLPSEEWQNFLAVETEVTTIGTAP